MKNYLIIGGSSGIGESLSNLLAESCHRVYATFNKHTQQSESMNIRYSYLDVMDEDIHLDFVPSNLDGLVYCPWSINLMPFTRFKPVSFEDDYKQVLGAIKVLQTALRRLKDSGNASIVLFSTEAVQLGFNFHSQVAASKGAIEGLTRSLSAEWAPSVRVNAIAPSLTNTSLAGNLLCTEEKMKANGKDIR
jgi:NAD(P)-dependent dehydrogenase (short-subunit alcohol dehydrogenase family)